MNTSNAEIMSPVSPLALHAKPLERAAWHEAAHATCDVILGVQVTRLTITPLPGCYRGCCNTVFPLQHQVSPAEWERHQRRSIISLLVGPLTAWKWDGEFSPLDMGGADDARKVLKIIAALYPESPEEDRKFFLGNMAIIAKQLLLDPATWSATEAVSASLLRYKTLTAPMIAAVLHDVLPAAERTRLRDLTWRMMNVLKAAMELPPLSDRKDTPA